MFDDIPFLLAFTGGLVATVNPCGFAMLPAYLSFFLGIESADAKGRRGVGVGQALRVGMTVAVGFLVVFGAAWVLLAAGLRATITVVPWAALVVGVGLVVLGGWMFSGRPLPIRLPTPGRAAEGRSTAAIFAFGLGYAVASLSCTLPVFLAVVAGTATRLSAGAGMAAFGVYALGMALPLLAVTVALAIGRDTLVRRAQRLGAAVNRVAAGLLVVAGLYIVVYWSVLLTDISAAPLDAMILVVERASSRVTMLIGERPLAWAAGFAAVVAVTAALRWGARHERARRETAT